MLAVHRVFVGLQTLYGRSASVANTNKYCLCAKIADRSSPDLRRGSPIQREPSQRNSGLALPAALSRSPDAELPDEFAADEGALQRQAVVVGYEAPRILHRGVCVELIRC